MDINKWVQEDGVCSVRTAESLLESHSASLADFMTQCPDACDIFSDTETGSLYGTVIRSSLAKWLGY